MKGLGLRIKDLGFSTQGLRLRANDLAAQGWWISGELGPQTPEGLCLHLETMQIGLPGFGVARFKGQALRARLWAALFPRFRNQSTPPPPPKP